jgi:hypothetical protein
LRKGRITLKTVVRDCLYLNWAIPVRAVPKAPEPLRFEEHMWRGEAHVFASALLFRHDRLHVRGVPFFRVSYPQLSLRFYARDGEGVPSVLLRGVMVPSWVAPSARLVAGQPVVPGRFRYPSSDETASMEPRSWEIRRRSSVDGGALVLTGRPAHPEPGHGPDLGSWDRTTSYFRLRRRGYVDAGSGLRRADVSQRSVPIVPMRVELREGGLLESFLPLGGEGGWPALHSAWICPEIPFVFELGEVPDRGAPTRSRVPVAVDSATFEGRPGARNAVLASRE